MYLPVIVVTGVSVHCPFAGDQFHLGEGQSVPQSVRSLPTSAVHRRLLFAQTLTNRTVLLSPISNTRGLYGVPLPVAVFPSTTLPAPEQLVQAALIEGVCQ